MASAQADAIQRSGAETSREMSDRQLLERFLTRRDEAAFTGLLQRHSRTVWGVCRRLLHQEQDAEDAFQAVFLLLARKAASIRKREAVGSFLYGVAYRVALRARRSAARRRQAETCAPGAAPGQPPCGQAAFRELQRLLDEEVQRLPEKHRAPFVLCCLEGMSKAEAAGELGWKEGTLSCRLAQARKLLQQRLARRGITLSAALTVVALAQQTASAAAPVALVQATAQAALAGKTAALSPAAVGLAKGLCSLTGVKVVGSVLLAATVLAAGAAAFKAEPAHQEPAPRIGDMDERVLTLAFSPDGQRLVTAGAFSRPGHLQIWDVGSGKQLVSLRGLGGTRAVAFSPDGQVLATGHFGGDIKLRDPLTGKIRTTLAGHDFGANGLAFSADGALLASAGLDQTVKVWDMKALRERATFLGHKGHVLGVAFFRHGRALVTGGKDQTVRVWDLDTGKERLVLEGHSKPVEAVAISPDDKVVVSGSWDRTIKFWDPDTGKETAVLRQNGGSIQAVAFSPDGAILASSGSDGRVYFWEVASRKLVKSIQQHDGKAWGVAFSPDGKLFASSGDDKVTKLRDRAASRNVATLSVVGAEASPDEPEVSPPPRPKGWLAAAVLILGLLLTSALAVWLRARQRRQAEKGPSRTPAVGTPADPGTTPAPVSLLCPGCGKLLKVKAEQAGKKGKCPHCGQPVSVPATESGESGLPST